jgi:NADH:ubiquinone oxidoreductase subunit
MVTYDDFLQTCYDLADDASAGNKAFLVRMGNTAYRRAMRYFGRQFEERTKTTTTVAGQQYYQLPIDYAFGKSFKTLVGAYSYPTKEVLSQTEWDNLNRITTLSNTRPTRHYIRLNSGIGGDEVGFWPTPSATGDPITFVYEAVPSDVVQPALLGTTGVLTNASNAFTDSAGIFNIAQVGRYLCAQPPYGDGQYYRITNYTSATAVTLQNYYEGATYTGATYGIYDLFGIAEEAQMVPVYYAMWHFYLMRRNPTLTKSYKEMHDEEMKKCRENEVAKSHDNIITRRGGDNGALLDYPPWFPSNGITVT